MPRKGDPIIAEACEFLLKRKYLAEDGTNGRKIAFQQVGLNIDSLDAKTRKTKYKLLREMYDRNKAKIDEEEKMMAEEKKLAESANPHKPTDNNMPMTEESVEQKLPPYKTTSHLFVPRYTGPKEKDLTKEQIDIRDEILLTRKRTGLAGPFGPWLARPNIASPAQKLGKACRYDTDLSFRERELVILLTASKFKSHAEFDIHQGEALRAGLSLEVIQSIPRDYEFCCDLAVGRVSCSLEKEFKEGKSSADRLQREIAIVRFTAELLDTATVSDDTYQRTKQILGDDEVLVDITSIVGYYTYVAYTLNVFNIPSKSPTL